MKFVHFLMTVIALTFFAAGMAHAAGAGGTQLKAWVSGEGSDTVSCGAVSTPCRSLQYAHDNIVEPGGTIYVHDVGGYGQLIISHAISVINDGVGAAVINAASGDGIDVQAGTNDAVIIKGLTLDGAGTGTNGINLSSASSLTIMNCLIKGFGSGTGILLEPNSGASDVNFIISDTTVLGSGQDGIGVIGLGYAQSSIRGAITRVETSNNGGSGIDFFGHNRFAVVNLAVTDVNASFNNVGVTTEFTGNLALHRVVLTGNLTGLNAVNGGAVQTFQDDLIAYNGTNISGISLSPASNGLY